MPGAVEQGNMDHVPRWLAGAAGGVAAALAKFVGQHMDVVSQQIAIGSYATAINYGLGYLFGVPFLMALGALAVFFDEQSRSRLFVLGIAAPALFTTLSSGKSIQAAADLFSVTPAYAQTQLVTKTENVSVVEGIKLFLNLSQPEPRYRVVVGSFKDRTAAALRAEVIRKEAPTLSVFVGERQPENEFYPVVVGGYVTLTEALKIQDGVLKMKSVDGA